MPMKFKKCGKLIAEQNELIRITKKSLKSA